MFVATAIVRCKSKGYCYLPRDYCTRWTAHRTWAERPWRGGVWEERKLAKMGCSGSLAPRFVDNDNVTSEIIYSTAQAHHEVLTLSQATLCGTPVWAPPRKSASQERLPLWPLYRYDSGEGLCYGRLYYGCCYGCSINQERMNVSAVPVAPWVSFQPLSSRLAYPGFSELWGQWDTARQVVTRTRWRAMH